MKNWRSSLNRTPRFILRGLSLIWRRRYRFALGSLAGLGILFMLYLGGLYDTLTDRFEGKRWRLPSKVYSDSFILYPGQNIGGIRLLDRLERLGYRPVSGRPAEPGDYRLQSASLGIFLHDFAYPDHAFQGIPIRLDLDGKRITAIAELPSESGRALVELEPEMIAGFYDETWEERDLIRLDEVPQYLIEAIIVIEDSRFYHHSGIDPRSIARAFWVNLREGKIVQGGSTLTQQLVKNFYLTPERTFRRKLNEIFMAVLLDLRYTKEEILEAYLNEIYFAQSGTMGIYGVGEAARYYFGKQPGALTLGESALLAGMVKSPNLFSPFVNPDRAQVRRTAVLERMLRLGKIGQSEYARARSEPIPRQPPVQQGRVAPYFIDFIRRQLNEIYDPAVLTSDGLRIFTTLDMQQQQAAEEAVRTGLVSLEEAYPYLHRDEPLEQLQASLIVLQPQTGQIKAMVGGRDYGVSQYNRVTQARRQPGSVFKPFVYAAALTRGESRTGEPYTPGTLLEDSLTGIVSDEGIWTPQNYDKIFHGTVTLRTALEDSLNVATVRLAEAIGTEEVINTAQAMGIRTPLRNVPSLALGSSEVSSLELSTAYATIANGGIRVEPLAIKEVLSADGRVLERRAFEMSRVLTPQQAFLLTHLLEGVLERGTGRGVRKMGFLRPAAGKTGTTSRYHDAWFSGFTPDLLATVWVGYDIGSIADSAEPSSRASLRLSGAQAALPIWSRFMEQATSGLPVSRFTPPPGIVFEMVDPQTGLLSNRNCPDGIREAFIEGTEPKQGCAGSGDFQRKIFKWLKQLMAAQ